MWIHIPLRFGIGNRVHMIARRNPAANHEQYHKHLQDDYQSYSWCNACNWRSGARLTGLADSANRNRFALWV
jgi:hypothetical protein